jgi:hypothetical protein
MSSLPKMERDLAGVGRRRAGVCRRGSGRENGREFFD